MGCNFCWSVSVIVIVSIVYVGPLLIVKEKEVRSLEVYTFIRDDHLLLKKSAILLKWDVAQVFFKNITLILFSLRFIFKTFLGGYFWCVHALIYNIKMKPKLPIYDLINDLGYLYVPYYRCIFVTRRKL